MSHAIAAPTLYGLMAEFETPTELVHACKAIGFHKSAVPLIVLLGGIMGGLSGFGLQYWINVIAYPLNIGGKPYDSWPAFIVPTFEMTILFAGLAGVFGMFALNGLPMPYHPLFHVEQFSRVTRDKFFLCVEAADPKFDIVDTQRFMEGLKPVSIAEVPH